MYLDFNNELRLSVEIVAFELDEENIPIDIILILSKECFKFLEENASYLICGPWNFNKVDDYSDSWKLLYGRGKLSTDMEAADQEYYEVLISRMIPFKVHNPNGKVRYY